MSTRPLRYVTLLVLLAIAWLLYRPRLTVIPVQLDGNSYPQLTAPKENLAGLPRLVDIPSILPEYRNYQTKVIAAITAQNLDPSKYVTEIHVDDSAHIIRFDLWHISVAGIHFDANVVGDPSGKCRTVLVDMIDGKVTSIFGWK